MTATTKVEEGTEERQDTPLRVLVDLYSTFQKQRIAFGNRISAIERGADTANVATLAKLQAYYERFSDLERQAADDIKDISDDYPIIAEMAKVKGVGGLLAAKIVSMIDITRSNTVSQLWMYAGYGVKDGERLRPTKGEKLCYNKRLKTTCFLVAQSFLRTGSPYREVYDSAKAYYQANRPDWTKHHIHLASMRKMTKMWLSHLWEVWRQMEGLETRELYVVEKLGHEGIRKPQEFGWLSD